MMFCMNEINRLLNKFCKWQANWIKLIFWTDPYWLKMTITFWFIYGSQSAQRHAFLRAELHTGKIWCAFINFEVTCQNVILYGLSIWNGNGNGSSWLVLHFQVLVDSIDLMWHYVAKSSHLVTNVMTDRQTHRHMAKINIFLHIDFQLISIVSLKDMVICISA